MIVSPTVTDLDYQGLVNWDDPLTQGLAYWHLNLPGRFGGTRAYDLVAGRVATRTGMASPPTSTSGQGTTTRPGGWGEERLDGMNDCVLVPHSPAIAPSAAISVGLWMRSALYCVPLDKQNVEDATDSYQFYVESGPVRIHIKGSEVTGAISVLDGSWHHILGTYDGSAIRLYIDGVPDGSVAASGAITYSTIPLAIGKNHSAAGGSYFCTGAIDNVTIHNRALTASEARALVAEARTGHPRMLRRVGVVVMGGAAAGFTQSLGGTLASSGTLPRAMNKALVGAV